MTPPNHPPSDDLPADELQGDAIDEWQSAWYDREQASPESVSAEHPPLLPTPGRLQDYQRISQMLQSLPVEPLPADFVSRVVSLMPDEQTGPWPRTQSATDGGLRWFSPFFWGCLAASLAGLVVVVGRWQPMGPSNLSDRASRPLTSAASAVRSALASQLEEIPPEKLAIVRIRVPQRGALSDAEIAAMNLTVQAFGEHWITQVPEDARLAKGAPAAPGPAPVAARTAGTGVASTGEVSDPRQLLVVGESEAIVQAIEQLLRNLEQTELEEEIRAVARTEFDQLSSELSPSLGQFLDKLEQTWSPAGLPAEQVVNRETRPSNLDNATAAGLREETPDGTRLSQTRSRGSMAWVPPDSAPLPFPRGTPATAAATPPAGGLNQVPAIEAKGARLADEPARPAMGGRARSLENPRFLERSLREADKAPGISPEPESAEGRRPRRVLIQLICDPAG